MFLSKHSRLMIYTFLILVKPNKVIARCVSTVLGFMYHVIVLQRFPFAFTSYFLHIVLLLLITKFETLTLAA